MFKIQAGNYQIMKKYLISACLLLICGLSWAQQQVITGTIKDSDGPLPGVSVYQKGSASRGTVTNLEGKYRLVLDKENLGVLTFTYIGYLSQEVRIAGRTEINLTMMPDAKGLEEVIVIGYGTQKKLTNTGAVSAISGDNLRQSPSASLQNSLIGRVPGVITQQQSGRPGGDGAKILVRGLSTTNGNGAPLVIVDDLEYAGNIADIDPDQIETFTVLKDASTTAVYGIRGANGVIVITTRRGKAGKAQITVRSETSLQQPSYVPEYLDSYESALLFNQAVNNDIALGIAPSRTAFSDEAIAAFKNGTDPYRYPNVDWTDELIKPFSLQNRSNINVQGGMEKAKYFISAGYLGQDGLIKDFSQKSGMNSNYYYKRYNFRSNLDVQPSKSLTLNLDLSGNFSERNSPNNRGRANHDNVFFEISDMNQLAPWAYPIYNPDGSYGINPGNTLNNIVGRLAEYGYVREFRNDLTANFRATQKLDFITQGLSVKGVVGYNGYGGFTRSLTRNGTDGRDFPAYSYDSQTDSYTILNTNIYRTTLPNLSNSNNAGTRKLNWQASLNYDRTFGSKHRIYALGLYNYLNDISGANVPDVFEGYTFRLGYDYKSKYLLELNAGYNGTSKFSQAERYSLFPAVSAGWNISEEPFFKDHIKFIDLLKIRGSYGLTGSDNLSGGFDYVYLPTYNRSATGTGESSFNYSLGDTPTAIIGIRESTLGNIVTWEKERQSNIGVELRMFKGALNVVADVYSRYRYDILQERQVSAASGISSQLPPANIGKVRNRGFETQITYNGRVNELSYNVSGNVSVSKNKRVFFDEPLKAYPWKTLTGQSIGSELGYEFLGFYTEADIADATIAKPATGQVFAGDLKYSDLNGDGIINADDMSVMPYANLPNTILGLTLGASYKNFSFSVTAQSALNFSLSARNESVVVMSNNFREIHKDAWTPQNAVNPSFPRLSTVSNISSLTTLSNISTFWSRRSDYLRIKTAEIAYTLPKDLVGKVGLGSARIYVNGYNLLTWSLKAKNIYDIDPENQERSTGEDFYPQQKIYNLGVQVAF